MRNSTLALFSLLVLLCFVFSPVTSGEELTSRLWSAAKNGDVASVKELLAMGIDVDSPTKYNATALSFACDRGHVEVAKALLDAGADVNAKDSFYKATPLTWATGGGHGEIVKLLLDKGATGSDDALRNASSRGFTEVVKAIIESGKVKPEFAAACRNYAVDLGHDETAKLIDELVGEPEAQAIEVPAETLNSYAGAYQSDEGRQYKVELKNGKLMIGSPYRSAVSLAAVDEKTFKFFEITYTFNIQEDQVVGLSRKASGEPVAYKKLTVDKSVEPERSSAAVPEKSHQSSITASSANWPQFRGLGARGIADGQNAPETWDVEKMVGVIWKTPIPGLAHSCPIIWEDQVFVTTAVSSKGVSTLRTGLYGDVDSVDDGSPHTFHVLCLDKNSGAVIWERTAYEGLPGVKRHPKSTHANSTPATDGEHVVALFGTEGLYCYNTSGSLLWKKLLGELDSGWFYDEDFQWGFASSPIIFDEMVIVQCDVQSGSFVAAFDIHTGDRVWTTERVEIPTWATPTVYDGPLGAVLITNGTRHARGYDARTGEEIWRFSGHSEISVPTPFVADNLIFITSGYRPNKPIYALRLDAHGDISLEEEQTSNEHIAWSYQNGGPYLPTPIAYCGYLYTCSNDGILTCYETKTGKRTYQKRMRSGKAKSFTASPLAADGKLYFTSETGTVLVVQAGPKYELLHTNLVGEACLATPAISQGMFLLRTEKHAIAIGSN